MLKEYSWEIGFLPGVKMSLNADNAISSGTVKITGPNDYVEMLRFFLEEDRNLDGHHIYPQATPQDLRQFLEGNPFLGGKAKHQHSTYAPRVMLEGILS